MKKKILILIFILVVIASIDTILIHRLNFQQHQSMKHRESGQVEDLTTQQIKYELIPDEIPTQIEECVYADIEFFPIPKSVTHSDYEASFENSWMNPRTFGGDRGHEGTDIMLYPAERGLFPVISMTDGIVEKKGWLPKGGYRIGVRSQNDIYYYYAHLYDYAPDLEEGTLVSAGQLLGFAGDSGYSNIEGTVGNFPVHLHIGIYYDDADGKETSINPYRFLVLLESKKLQMEY